MRAIFCRFHAGGADLTPWGIIALGVWNKSGCLGLSLQNIHAFFGYFNLKNSRKIKVSNLVNVVVKIFSRKWDFFKTTFYEKRYLPFFT